MPDRALGMEQEVESMEQRLQMLKALMADEKARREAKAIPGGGNWRSGRQDGSGNGARYVDKVLRERPPPPPAQQAPLWTEPAIEVGRGLAPTKPASAGRVGRLRSAAEAAAGASVPVAVSPPPVGQAKSAAPRPGRFGARAPALPAAAAAQPVDLNETRDVSEAFSWRPDAAIARGDGDGFDSYEVRASGRCGGAPPLVDAPRGCASSHARAYAICSVSMPHARVCRTCSRPIPSLRRACPPREQGRAAQPLRARVGAPRPRRAPSTKMRAPQAFRRPCAPGATRRRPRNPPRSFRRSLSERRQRRFGLARSSSRPPPPSHL